MIVTHPKQKTEIIYTICLAPVHGESDFNRLVEFVEMNRILGVQKFVFYIMNKKHNGASFLEYLDFYKHTGIVDIYNWDMNVDGLFKTFNYV